MNKLAKSKKPKDVSITFKVDTELLKKLQKKADEHTEGNVSRMLRFAINLL